VTLREGFRKVNAFAEAVPESKLAHSARIVLHALAERGPSTMKVTRNTQSGRFLEHVLKSVGELGSFRPVRPRKGARQPAADVHASDWERLGQDMRRAAGDVRRRAKT